MFSGIKSERSEEYYIDTLLDTIQAWTGEMKIPSLYDAGVRVADFDRIVKITENKNNPTHLSMEEMHEALELAM
jgi:hypothetical protein